MSSKSPPSDRENAKETRSDEQIRAVYKYQEYLFKFYGRVMNNHLMIDKNFRRSIQCVRRTAIRWLEFHTSPVFGFPGEMHHPELEEDSCFLIETSFDSALLYPFLVEETEINVRLFDSLINAVKIQKRPETGFWGYYAPLNENGTAFIPEDIEDTSVSLLALYVADNVTKEYCQEIALKLIEHTLKDENGAMGTWLANLEPRKVLYKKHLEVIKLDANSLVNTLTFMAVTGMDGEPKMAASLSFVNKFVNELVKSEGKVRVLQQQRYYPNKIPVYMFLSRYVARSPTASATFGDKLKSLVRLELLGMDIEWSKAMDIACMILAALYLKLYDNDEVNRRVCEKLQKLHDYLPNLQLEDGSYGKHILFKMSHYGHYAGSKHVTTALVVSAMGRYQRQVIEGKENPKQI